MNIHVTEAARAFERCAEVLHEADSLRTNSLQAAALVAARKEVERWEHVAHEALKKA